MTDRPATIDTHGTMRQCRGAAGFEAAITSTSIAVALAAVSLTFGCASAKVWQRWSAGEQRRYFGLSCVASDSSLASYRALPEPELRDEWYRAFWSRDHGGVTLDEHRRRTDRSWQEFGREQCYRDDRGRIYVQYGEPADRWRNQRTWRYLSSKQLAGGAMMRERPWEVWQYPDQGLYFDFIEFNEAFRTWATVWLDRRHPVAFFRNRPAAPALVPAGTAIDELLRLPLECSWARFRSSMPGKVRWELYWRIPVAAAQGGSFSAIFALTDANGRQTTDTLWYDAVTPADSLPEPFVFGQRNLDLDPGHYRLEITLSAGTGTVHLAMIQAELIAYRPGIQECSDVELALLQDTTLIAPEFQKGKFKRVIPQIAGEIPARQPYFVYYEVYNLLTDAKGHHHVTTRLRMLQAGKDTLAERPFATGEFTDEEPGGEFHGCHCVYPQDLGQGELYLLISVEDQLSGRMTNLNKTVRLKE